MTTNEAINLIQRLVDQRYCGDDAHFGDALKLGIEALKYAKTLRGWDTRRKTDDPT